MSTKLLLQCSHCGDQCDAKPIQFKEHVFCCNGCLMVFQLLEKHNLQDYYNFESHPGTSIKKTESYVFEYLNDKSVIRKLLLFDEDGVAKVKLHLPQIHCSACLYLLENISKINPAIFYSKVDFMRKEATFQFRINEISLKGLVVLLSKIGYEPILSFDKLDDNPKSYINRSLIYKIGLAGFSFGNIMLLSFPEYLGLSNSSTYHYFGYINLVLILPVLLYSASDYFVSSFKSLRYGNLNLDIPIVIGMLTLFLRSAYEIMGQLGEGYLDSLAGFIFFLLIGKWFQSFTYKQLDFDRTYKSYFPISTTIKIYDEWQSMSIDKIDAEDVLLIRNQELIPIDCQLIKGHGRIDYSFVTGESKLLSKEKGDKLLAGGRQIGESIEVKALKKVDQSQLTQLWNDEMFTKKSESTSTRLVNQVSKYFTIGIILIATITFLTWMTIDPSQAFTVFTSVLIVACPCALALAIPFTYGNILRLLSRMGFHIRNVEVLEKIQDVNHIVFDKTGTITDSQKIYIKYKGEGLNKLERQLIKSSCLHSNHPLSKALANYFNKEQTFDLNSFKEFVGKGFEASKNNSTIRLGSDAFIFNLGERIQSGVFIEINGTYKGQFIFEHNLRDNIASTVMTLSQDFNLSLLSGDSDEDKERMQKVFDTKSKMTFKASPDEKLQNIKHLQTNNFNVMMIGDGLNDAGALKQSNVGIVISDNVNNFSPSCDAIIDAKVFHNFGSLIKFIRSSRFIIYGAFLLALVYNVIGLGFAITGNLSPIVAAILMPLSSISVIVYGLVVSVLKFKFVPR